MARHAGDAPPIVELDSMDPEFQRGVEVGMLWFTLTSYPDRQVEAALGTANVEMVIRMCQASGRRFRAVDDDLCYDAGHLHFVFEPSGT